MSDIETLALLDIIGTATIVAFFWVRRRYRLAYESRYGRRPERETLFKRDDDPTVERARY